MKLDFKSCVKCGSTEYEIKNLVLPERNKDSKSVMGFELGMYYHKICLNCGFTEIYSAKVLNKNEEFQAANS